MLSKRNKILLAVVPLLFFAFAARGEIVNVVNSGSDEFNKFDDLFKKYGGQFGVPWKWLKAICMNESSLGKAKSVAVGLSNPNDIKNSVSSDGLSWGLMQVTLTTARALEGSVITAVYLNDPENSVRLAAKVCAENIERFGIDDRESVIRAYNGGPNFMNRAQARANTAIYYSRFITNLAIIETKQGS